jgi:hypothetical protein
MSTPRYPGGDWRPLGAQTQPAMRSHDIVCLHTMVGSLTSTDEMFMAAGYGGTESHFGVGHDGKTLQWQDIGHTADANLDGAQRVLSIETADFGPGFDAWNTKDGSQVPAWTNAQLERLADLMAWLSAVETHAACPASWRCHQDGIPLEAIPDSRPGRRGIGWHRQGVESSPAHRPGYRVDGGERWSKSVGKVCPGDRRIAQIPALIERARDIAGGQPQIRTTSSQEDDMPMFTVYGEAGADKPAILAGLGVWRAITPEYFEVLSGAGLCKHEIVFKNARELAVIKDVLFGATRAAAAAVEATLEPAHA